MSVLKLSWLGRRYQRFLLALGMTLMTSGLVLTPTVFEQLRGSTLFWTNRVVVWTMDVTLVLVGVLVCASAVHTLGSLSQDLQRLIRSYRRTAGLLFGLTFSAFLLLVLEAGLWFFALTGKAESTTGTYTVGFFQADPVVGYKPKADCTVDSCKRFGAQVLYDARYTIDARGHRVTPSSRADGRPTVLFFGCSYTFGEGVQDDETLPHRFCLAAQNLRAVNAAFCGYGPQQMLAVLQAGELDEEIQDRDVVAIYVFIDNHVRRAIGSMRVVTYWGGDMPHYQVVRDGALVRAGSFTSNRPITSTVYALASKSQILRRLDIDFPLRLKREHFELTGRIITESAQYLTCRARTSRFFVVFYPGSESATALADCLRGTSIECLDYSRLFPDDGVMYRIPHDGHPNAAAHRCLGQQLADDIIRK